MTIGQLLYSLQWREPLWLLLMLQPIILLLLRWQWRTRHLASYTEPALQPWVIWHDHHSFTRRIFTRHTLYFISWILLAISAAGPRIAIDQPARQDKQDTDIIVVVDVSRSMLARDVQPSRLKRAQIELAELMQMMRNSRMGIILYTARPHLLVPLTHDLDALSYFLQHLDSIPMPTYGSDPVAALRLAGNELSRSASANRAAIVWITDGDFSSTDDAYQQTLETTVNELSGRDVPLYILGLGTEEGEAIPLPEGGWLTQDGSPLISRMDSLRLMQLAQSGGGRYVAVQNDDRDWHKLYQQGIAATATTQHNSEENAQVIWQELYAWALLPAVVLLFICLMPYRLPATGMNRTGLPVVALVLLCLATLPAFAKEAVQNKAYRLLDQHDYSGALQQFHEVPSYNGRMGEGISYYRLGDYSQAITSFSQAVLQATADRQRSMAIYNLGNSYFNQGDYATASQLYQDALLYQANHPAALNNLSISLELQKLIEKKLQEQAARRIGSGPKSKQAQQGLDINRSGSVSFDNEELRKSLDLPLPAIPAELLDGLIDKGLQHVRLASDEAGSSNLYHAASPQVTRARLRMRELEDRQVLLWKRLFEMEEGFPAPLEAPRNVPGVKPW